MGTLALFLALGCHDDGLTVHNSSPEVAVTSPMDGATVLEGQELTLRGSVGDAESALEELEVYWESSLSGTFTGALLAEEDTVELVLPAGLDLGTHTLQLTAIDESGAATSDRIEVTVVANTSPVVAIVSPEGGETVAADATMTLVGTVSDEHTSTDDLVVLWESGLAGQLLGEESVAGHTVTLTLPEGLEPGLHGLTLKAFDDLGAHDSDSVQVEALDDAAPTVVITSPGAGEVYDFQDTIVVQATVSDDRDSPEQIALEWGGLVEESWVTGVAQTAPDSNGEVFFSLVLECGNLGNTGAYSWTLSVTAEDTGGKTGSDGLAIQSNCMP